MPVAIADGPLGLEATHTWGPLTTPLNDLDNGLPRIRVDRITGLHSLPDADDFRELRSARLGEVVYPGFARGKTVTYEGRLQAASLQSLRQLAHAMRAGFAERSTEQAMTISPHPGYGTQEWFYGARALALDIDEIQANGPWQWPQFERPFTLSLRMSDPRFFALPQLTSGPHASGATVTIANAGTAPSDPAFSGTIAGTTITIENATVPTDAGTAQLVIDVPALLVGESIVIQFASRTITPIISGIPGDLLGYLDAAASDWWDEQIPGLVPGNNEVTVTGISGWSCQHYPAGW